MNKMKIISKTKILFNDILLNYGDFINISFQSLEIPEGRVNLSGISEVAGFGTVCFFICQNVIDGFKPPDQNLFGYNYGVAVIDTYRIHELKVIHKIFAEDLLQKAFPTRM